MNGMQILLVIHAAVTGNELIIMQQQEMKNNCDRVMIISTGKDNMALCSCTHTFLTHTLVHMHTHVHPHPHAHEHDPSCTYTTHTLTDSQTPYTCTNQLMELFSCRPLEPLHLWSTFGCQQSWQYRRKSSWAP